MRLFSNRSRPVPLGPYPLERLARVPLDDAALARFRGLSALPEPAPGNELDAICRRYGELYERFRGGNAAERAPFPDDLRARADDLKGLAYFLDATLVGACRIPAVAWEGAAHPSHTHAIVVLAETPRGAESGNPVHALIEGSGGAAARLRAAEVAVILAAYLRRIGFSATAHTPWAGELALPVVAAAGGLVRLQRGRLAAPFVGGRFALAAVATEMALATDAPLAPRRAFEGGLAWQLGAGGAETWWERRRKRARPGDASVYPMERVRRVERTTTLILDDEVPRIPKRANGFVRARMGDFGDKAQREVKRFAYKTPLADAVQVIIQAQVPYQDGPVAPAPHPDSADAARNARAVKTLMHHLGADIVGTCEAKRYAWYSHQLDGSEIPLYHRSAAVMVIDQGFETMEGASGDDWVSATQSMRAYMRGAQVAGVVAAWMRAQGHSARAHSNVDSDVNHVPLILLAGLGEMSRIGETVLNPYIGPRSKSAVVTTDMPLAWDKPIDFGLQDACAKCLKCARECPCDAITYGGPVMFNGYEQWKQDVHRCTAYRVTNQGGSACGRCMKTCPYNNEGLLAHRALLWAAMRWPWTRSWLARLDDKAGNGAINPKKRWWQDLEILEGGAVARPKQANRRELDLAKGFGLKGKQKIAYALRETLPPPGSGEPHPFDRKAGVAAAAKLESVERAKGRAGSA